MPAPERSSTRPHRRRLLADHAAVVPVGLRARAVHPPETNRIAPDHVALAVGEPLQFERLGRKHPLPPRKQATAQVMDAIAALSGQERVGQYNAPVSGSPD